MVFVNEGPPILRRRVLYIGSSVPRETAKGLEAIQQPLRDRYPVNDESNIEGIDSVISIYEDSIQLQYLTDADQVIHFPITSLTLCAAVRCITTVNGATGEKAAQFVSMTNPAAGGTNASRPSIFTAITRRTQGRRVLECHSFICASAKDAMDLVKSASQASNRARGIKGPQIVDTQSQVSTATFERSDPTRVSSRTVTSNRPSIRLVPGEQIIQEVSAGPEFFEPVPSQGYFYSSNKTEVKKFNIEKLNTEQEVKPVPPIITASPRSAFDSPRVVHANGTVPTLERDRVVHVVEHPRMVQVEQPRYLHVEQPYVQPRHVRVETSRLAPEKLIQSQPPPPPGLVRSTVSQAQPQQADTQAPPQQPNVHLQPRIAPQPMYFRPPPQFMHPPPPPQFIHPPPPPQFMHPPPPPVVRPVYIPVPVAPRPRFFSPPPSMMRRPYHPPPPMGPPLRPVFGPPVLVRRRPTESRKSKSSGSRSGSSSRSSGDKASSKSSRSRSPSPKIENTEPKFVVNGDADSLSESASRPKTPPRDYDRGRLSRRDEYERILSQKHSPLRERNVRMPPPMQAQYPYDYVYWRGGPGYMPYPPFMMPPPPHGAQFRSRSVPPPMREYMDRDYRKKKSKKEKKKKKKSKKFRDAPSEVSTDSYAAGYHSDMNPPVLNEGYQFYPPRDFRRRDKQFMNERSFSKSIAEQYRQTRDSKHQTAYDLNEAINGPGPEEEFKMY